MSTRETVGVSGVGYVGLVTAACLAELGHHVVCRDIAPERVAMLQRGEVPIHEPGVPELLQRNAERLTFTLDMEDVFRDARIAIICVDTPPTASGDADLSRVEAVIDALPASAEGAVLVMKSTVPVGTGNRVRSELDARGRDDVGYVSNPEFLREGSAVADFRQPDRVVVGGDRPDDVERVARLYQDLNAPILTTDTASAEMIKLASNAFWRPRSRLSTRSPTSASALAPMLKRSRAAWGWTRALVRAFCDLALAMAAVVFRRTSLLSSSWRVTPAIRFNCWPA